MRKHFLATLLVLIGWAVTAPASWVGAAHAQFNLPIPGTGVTNVTGNLATLNSPLNPLGNGYYCDTYTVSLNANTNYMFNMSANNGTATMPQPTGTAQLFLLDSTGKQVDLTTGGDPNLYWYNSQYCNGAPGWYGAINPSGGADLVYTCITPGNYTLVCTTMTPNSQFPYPLMAMQMNTLSAPQYTVSSFPYTNNNVTLCSFNSYANNPLYYFIADVYSLQLPPGLFIFTGTTTPGAAQDISMLLVDSNGNVVVEADPNVNGAYPLDSPSTFQFTSPGGTYTLVVTSYGAIGPGAAYQAEVYSLSVAQPPSGTTALFVNAPAPIPGSTATVTVTVLAENSNDGAPAGNVMASIDGGVAQTQPLTAATANTSTATFTFTITASGNNHPVAANYVPMGTTTGGANWLASSGSGSVATLFSVSVPVNAPGAVSASSYSGAAATSSGDVIYYGGGGFSGHHQDWYSVTLTAGQTYVISLWTTTDSYMSLQYGGAEVAFDDDAGQYWLGTGVASQITYNATTGGVYTVIVTTVFKGANMNYTLTIPNPTPPATTVNPLTLPYSTTGSFSTSSYYGPAAADKSSPPIVTNWTLSAPMPPWVDYFQNWYSFPLAAGSTYTFTMTMTMTTGANAFLSLQSGNSQVAYGYSTSAQATITFTPQNSGNYTLICSQDITGPGNSYSLTITGAGSVGTKTTILQGLDMPPANLNITVIVTALGGPPTGNVTLSLDGGTGITQALSGGQTVFSIPNPVPGFQTVTANYLGALPTYLPSTASISLQQGIPNTKLVPPGRDNAELRAIYALGSQLEPAAYSVETSAVQCWVASLDYRKG